MSLKVTTNSKNPKMEILGDASIGNVMQIPEAIGKGQAEIVDIVVKDCVCEKQHLTLCYVLEFGFLVYECEHEGYLWVRSN